MGAVRVGTTMEEQHLAISVCVLVSELYQDFIQNINRHWRQFVFGNQQNQERGGSINGIMLDSYQGRFPIKRKPPDD